MVREELFINLIVSHLYSVKAVFLWLVALALICDTLCATDACVFYIQNDCESKKENVWKL